MSSGARADTGVVDAVMEQVLGALAGTDRRPVVIGICGSQGSGKTTLAAAMLKACAARGLRAATLSIDDIYLAHAARQDLARRVHPLFATRGVPGTHDVALGLSVIEALERGEAAPLPRFDKARDDRAPVETWPGAPQGCEVLLFEGWCVGARPQTHAELAEPVNALERDEDPYATWRESSNLALASDYAPLFAGIDRLVLLAAPDFSVVEGWRLQQERELEPDPSGQARGMDEAAIARFVRHYERLTRHILAEMPARADLVVRLDAQRAVLSITSRR